MTQIYRNYAEHFDMKMRDGYGEEEVAAELGIVTITRLPLWNMIPCMPFIRALFAGFALLALAALSAIGTEYSRLYIAQLIKAYLRLHKSVMGNKGTRLPSMSTL